MEGGELTQTVGDGRSRSGRRAGRAHPTRLARRKGRDGDRKRPHSIRSQDGSPFTLQYPTHLLVILLDDSELHLIGQRMNLSVGRDGKNGLTTHRLDRMSSADNNQTGSGCFHDAGALGNGCDRLNRDVPRSRMGCHPARSLDLRTHERDRNEFLIWRLFRIASRRRKGTRVTDTDVAIPEYLHFRNTENSTRDEFARSAVEFGISSFAAALSSTTFMTVVPSLLKTLLFSGTWTPDASSRSPICADSTSSDCGGQFSRTFPVQTRPSHQRWRPVPSSYQPAGTDTPNTPTNRACNLHYDTRLMSSSPSNSEAATAAQPSQRTLALTPTRSCPGAWTCSPAQPG